MITAALVVSIVAVAGSLGAVWYARRSARSSATSAAAAGTTAALDASRRSHSNVRLPVRAIQEVTVSSADEEALIALDRDLLIKEGWPRSVAEQMARQHARERAIRADQEQSRATAARESRPRSRGRREVPRC
jgi:hypothetical protein